MYQPSMLVVGTRGRSPVRGFLLGSTSRYCLDHSPVPVVVVRPEGKVNKDDDEMKLEDFAEEKPAEGEKAERRASF